MCNRINYFLPNIASQQNERKDRHEFVLSDSHRRSLRGIGRNNINGKINATCLATKRKSVMFNIFLPVEHRSINGESYCWCCSCCCGGDLFEINVKIVYASPVPPLN